MKNIEDTFDIIDKIIEAQKKARQANDYLTLLVNAEAMLERIPDLINYAVDQEHSYRKFEAKLADLMIDGKRNSASYAESQAKATVEYKNWVRARLFQELIYEYVALSKKLAGSVDNEFSSSFNK